jgi:hypothetical protein
MSIVKLQQNLSDLFQGKLHFKPDNEGYIKLPYPTKENGTFEIRLLNDDPVCPNLELKSKGKLKIRLIAVTAIYTALLALGGEMEKGNGQQNDTLGMGGVELESIDGFIAHYIDGVKYGAKVTRKHTYVLGILVALGLCECEKGKPARLI